MTLIQHTAGFSPPVAARALGYAGVALYEALVPGMPGFQSLAGQLTGLTPLSPPNDVAYHWPSVANAALAAVLRSLFLTAPAADQVAGDALEAAFAAQFAATVSPGQYRRSVRRGLAVAVQIFEWSRTDGADAAYLHNFPPYTPPVGPGLWVPTGSGPALQPSWGSNRPFALASADDCAPPVPTLYSASAGSAFYSEALEVRDAVNMIVAGRAPEHEAIARFWADGAGSVTPPGHSISILTQVIRASGFGLDVAAEAYARLGIAVADAFIACWRTKYRYNLLRPVTYIQTLIDPGWTSLLTTPPFPEYTSGHSVQSGAAARVLTDLFGPRAFLDQTHSPARAFASFFDAAAEAAISRLYGGIHFRPAIERGLAQGICVGEAVSALSFQR